MSELIQLSQAGNILSNIGNRLVTNQTLLKVIKYDSMDALSRPELDINEIVNLVGKGNDLRLQRIFKTPFNNQIIDEVRSELRFFLPVFSPQNIYLSEVIISFQIIVHNALWELNDNQLRPLILVQEILQDFNGHDIGSIGELQLDGAIRIYTWNQNFSGYQINMKTRTR